MDKRIIGSAREDAEHMTQGDVASVEQELGVHLPHEYREVLVNSSDLRALTHVLGGVVYPVFDDSLYLEPDRLIDTNTWERKSEAATEYVFPGWWRTYFIIGSNGAGDYYCVRLDGIPGVWFLSNDSGEVNRSYGSLGEYIAMRLEQYRLEQSDSPEG
jgi:cell wall assembly regulator SMI1